MNTPRSILFPVLFATLLAGTSAQKPEKSPEPAPVSGAPIAIDKNGLTVPAGEVTANDLIDATAKFLGRNILWSPSELGRIETFTFQRPLSVDAPGCEELLTQLLATRALVVLPIDEGKQLYEVVSINGQRQRDVASAAAWRTPDEVLRRDRLKQVVVTTVPLQHIDAQIATNALRPFYGMHGGNNASALAIGNVGTSNAILLQGMADQVANAIRVLQVADRPLQERAPELFQLGQSLTGAQQQITELQANVKRLQDQVAALHKALAERK